MTPFKTQAHIHSLDGAIDEITVLDIKEDGRQTIYIVDYRGVKCSAIFNPFNCTYYADDVYGRIPVNIFENVLRRLSVIARTRRKTYGRQTKYGDEYCKYRFLFHFCFA